MLLWISRFVNKSFDTLIPLNSHVGKGIGRGNREELLLMCMWLFPKDANRFIRRIPTTSEQWHRECNFLQIDSTYHILLTCNPLSPSWVGAGSRPPWSLPLGKIEGKLLVLLTASMRSDAWYAILFFLPTSSSQLARNSKSRVEQLKVLNHAASLMGDRRIITVSLELLLSLVGRIIISTSWRPPEAAYRHGPAALNGANIII